MNITKTKAAIAAAAVTLPVAASLFVAAPHAGAIQNPCTYDGPKNYAARITSGPNTGGVTVGWSAGGQCYRIVWDQSCLSGGTANDWFWYSGGQCI